jgi:acyl-coenzyme A synthetase/AMP-(fatty) acid ligase
MHAMNKLPLLRGTGVNSVFAYRRGEVIRVQQFLSDVFKLAALLPDRRHVLNLCEDRYHFSVGFAAALLREQVSLLPPNQTPDLVGQLSGKYQGLYCLTDAASGPPSLTTVFYPPSSPGSVPVPTLPEISASQVAAILFTSGSTGEPVPSSKSWRSLVTSAVAEGGRLGMSAYPGMVILGTVPPQHMYGLESTVLLVMQNGLAMHAGRPFYTADIRAALAALPPPRGLVTTPVHLRALLTEKERIPEVDFLLCATAPLSPQLAAEAEARLLAPLYEIYGCTEAGQLATRRTVQCAEWRALPGVRLYQDEKGTWATGGHVESAVLLNDVIELRDAQTFLLHGRVADLVNIAGKRTSLANLNYHLNSIEGVVDGVFLMPEEEGEAVTRLMALVVAPGLSSETVTEALRQRIDAAFLPRPLCFVDELPRNATGKLPRGELTQLFARSALKAG